MMDTVKFLIGFFMLLWLPIMVGGLAIIYKSYDKVRKMRGEK